MIDRSIIITGCSSGIGLDAVRTLHSKGWQTIATCRREADVARLRDEGLTCLRLDYEDPASVATAVDKTLEMTDGKLGALFNNGAYAIPGPIEDLSRDAMTAAFNANFLGWHDLTVRLIPAMRRSGGGKIVNCSSVLGLVSPPMRGSYNATKFALEAWSDALRIEMKGTGIHVILIEPGPIDTPFRQNAIKAFERWVDWEASARVEEYRETLLDRLYEGSGGTRFELPASAVTEKLVKALEASNPAPRYFVTTPTYLMNIARRVLPTRALDALLSRG